MKKGFGKRVLAAASAFVLAASLAACGTQKKKEAGLQDVNIVLDWYPNAIHAFIYEAIERGYYAEESPRARRNSVSTTSRILFRW